MVNYRIVYPYLTLDGKRRVTLRAVKSRGVHDFSGLLNYFDRFYPLSSSKPEKAVQKRELEEEVLGYLIDEGYLDFNDGNLTRTKKRYVPEKRRIWEKNPTD